MCMENILYIQDGTLSRSLVEKYLNCSCEVDKGYFSVKCKSALLENGLFPEYKTWKVMAGNIHQGKVVNKIFPWDRKQ